MAQRSVEEIRASMEANRQQLAVSVQQLHGEVARLADWRSQLQRHQPQVLAGAAVAGFLIGGGIAALGGLVFGRRRRG